MATKFPNFQKKSADRQSLFRGGPEGGLPRLNCGYGYNSWAILPNVMLFVLCLILESEISILLTKTGVAGYSWPSLYGAFSDLLIITIFFLHPAENGDFKARFEVLRLTVRLGVLPDA